MKSFKDLNIQASQPLLQGDKIKIERILNRAITVLGYEIRVSKFDRGNGKCLYIQIELEGQKRVVFTGSGVLMDTIDKVPKESFPFTTTIVKDNDRFQFT